MSASADGGVGGVWGEVTSSVVAAGRRVRLVRPSDPDRLLDDPSVHARNRADDYMPYWAYLWPGSFLLAEAVAAEPRGVGTRALEIGCGLGLGGLVGLTRGWHVHFTDYDPAPLGFVARSAAANGFGPEAYSTGLLDWRTPGPGRYDLILGADVLYEKRLVPLVAGVLDAMLAPGGLALIAGPYRVATEGFAAEARSRGLACREESVELDAAEVGAVRGAVFRVRRGERPDPS